MYARALALLGLVVATRSLTLDEDVTNSVKKAASAALHDGEVAILLRGPHGQNLMEELLHAKGAEDSAITLAYNKKNEKVSLEVLHGGHLKSVSWLLGDYPRGSLLLVMTSSKVKLVVGCKQLHWRSMSGRYDLLATLASHKMKLYIEEKSPVKVYNSEREGLEAICDHNTMKPPTLTKVDETDFEEVKDFLKKHPEDEMQGDDYRAGYADPNALPVPTAQRGDIPSNVIESCDDEVIRQLTLLRQTIEQLRREIGDQKGTIDNLRSQLRQCCNRVPTAPPVERCSGSSCYPG